MAQEMAPCSSGLGQDQGDKGWHCCYLISHHYNAGTESAFHNQRLTVAPYLFIPRHPITENLSSQMHHSQGSQGMTGTQLAGVYSQLDGKGFSPLTLMAAAAPKPCISLQTDVHAKLCTYLSHPRGTSRFVGIKPSQCSQNPPKKTIISLFSNSHPLKGSSAESNHKHVQDEEAVCTTLPDECCNLQAWTLIPP